jgi:hypothetical protein
MGKVIVINHVTLDGVMQGPGRPDEDTRDGFVHGGWAAAGADQNMGSGVLIGSLMATDLIDEYLLFIHPLVLGTGRRLFPDGAHASLRLLETVATTTGVAIAAYERA